MDGLKHNLLSVSQFTDKGYEVNFKTKQCNIINKKEKKLALQVKVKLDISTTKF